METKETIQPRLLDLADAAAYLGGAKVFFVRNLLWNGEIPFLRIGKRFCVAREDLDRWVDRNKRREVQ